MKKYLFLTAAILSAVLIFSATASADFNPDDVIEIRIENIDRKGLMRLTRMGASVDAVWGNTARVYISSDMIKQIENMGYSFTTEPTPKHSRMSDGYHTVEELASEMEKIAEAHPDICRLENIGLSYQQQNLLIMKISDHVNEEEDEPEVKYISTMHGDEPVGMELCMKLINLLTGEYGGKDTRITRLVDEMEIWIMPLMNPDGYVHKTRYNAQGKDLNRSFPDRVKDPYNITKARPTEIQHLMNWGFSHSPVLAANFHTGAELVNYPYDSDPDETAAYSACPDDALFKELSLAYSSKNPTIYSNPLFENGITNGVAWYTAYGGMQDWNYIWQGCNEVTVELWEEKWPPFSDIETIWNDNKESMLNYMEWAFRGIRGIVTDSKTGKPLKAEIRVEGIDDEVVCTDATEGDITHKVFTDPEVGDYHRILLPGTYSLIFSAEGYLAKTVKNIAVTGGDAVRQDIKLSPKPATDSAALLANGISVENISQSSFGRLYYKIQVPPGTAELRIFAYGGTGDCDLYVKYGRIPTEDDIEESSVGPDNNETIVIQNPRSGDWYVLLYAFEAVENVSLKAAYLKELSNGIEISGLSGAKDSKLFFKIEIPRDQKNLMIDTWGGTGDVNIYVRYSDMPDSSNYDEKCDIPGNDENIYIKEPKAGVWYIVLNSYENFSEVSVKAEYNTLNCNYTISSAGETFNASGGNGTLYINTGDNCLWKAITYNTWIQINPDTEATVNSELNYKILPNESNNIRAGNIKIADQWITVVQVGKVQAEPDKLTNGSVTPVSETQGDIAYYQIYVPDGQKSLVIEISGGADLYLRSGELPTQRIYDFHKPESGNGNQENNKSVTVENPRQGIWYIMLYAYESSSDISLKAQFAEQLDLEDVIVILKVLIGLTPTFPDLLIRMDFDNNGKADVGDIIYVLKLVAQ